jgi:recombination protein RecR
MTFSSQRIEKAVEAFAGLPGIGRKTALRLVLHLLKQPPPVTHQLAQALVSMRDGIRACRVCFNLSDDELCRFCADAHRDRSTVCVVENVRDLMAVEETGQFRGVYHVLGGVLSPMDGIGPADLNIDALVQRAETGGIKEAIFAISPTIEGETTMYYLSKKLQPLQVNVSAIARGVAFGGDLEYADELTLGRSIAARVPYTAR